MMNVDQAQEPDNQESVQQWHVFYRTVGMQETGASGWRRSDYLAETASEAIDMLMYATHNIAHARAYPGSAALTVVVEYSPEVIVKHEPHFSTDKMGGGLI